MSGRYEAMFARLTTERRGAFVPFVTLGDPDLALCRRIVERLIRGGADALELGVPFSDPIADGPAVQGANVRALASGVTPDDCWALLRDLRAAHPELPMGLLVYANLVEGAGRETFYRRAADSGVDSVLIADVPSAEAAPFVELARSCGVHAVLIVPPEVGEDRLEIIARLTSGYTYVLARGGVTGADEQVSFGHGDLFRRLADLNAPPSLLGFGISRPEHVRAAIAAGAAGAISGSAVVRRIELGQAEPETMLDDLESFVASMRAATDWGEERAG